MKLISVAFAFVAVTAISCGGGAKPGTTTPPSNTPPTDPHVGNNKADEPAPPAEERLLLMFERLSTELVTAGTDCDKYAQYVKTWTVANGRRYKQLHAQAKTMSFSAKRLSTLNHRLEHSLGAVVKGYSRCRSSDAATKAFKAFDALIERF